MKRRWSLQWRLVLFVLVLVTALLGSLGVALSTLVASVRDQVVDDELSRRIERISRRLEVDRGGALRFGDDDEEDDDEEPHGAEGPFQVQTRRGGVLVRVGPASLFAASAAASPVPPTGATVRHDDGSSWRVRTLAVTPHHDERLAPEDAVVVSAAAPLRAFSALVGRFRTVLLLTLALGVLLGGLGAWWVARLYLSPLRRLVREVSGIEATSLHRRLDTAGLDAELAQLASAFNSVLERVQMAFDRQRQFIARASHALRTPLAGVLSQAEVALRKERSAEAYQEAIADIAAAARESAAVVDGVLAQSRADLASGELRRAPVPLDEVAQALRRLFAPRAEQLGIALGWELAPGLVVDADRPRLLEALEALLDNALRYTPRGGEAGLRASPEGTGVALEIWDSGLGIGADEAGQVFERFFRGQAATQSQQPGSGLGLSMVRAIADAHGARVELKPRDGGGTRAILWWPSPGDASSTAAA